MKRIIGLLLLILAIAGTVNVVRKFSNGTPTQRTGNAAYDRGQQAGKYAAPVVVVVMGLAGLWLLFQSDDMRPASPPRRTPSRYVFPQQDSSLEEVPAKPWFKTTPAIVGFSVAGTIVVLIVGLTIVGVVSRSSRRGPRPIPPQPMQMNAPVAGQANATTAYAVGDKVEANWAGGWIPGKITEVNPGGFSVMVQLEDKRFARPIFLPVQQLRK